MPTYFSTSASTIASTAWDDWCDAESTSANTSFTAVWYKWAATSATTSSATAVWGRWANDTSTAYTPVRPAVVSAEERSRLEAERVERERQRRLAEEERVKQQKAADEKANELLQSCLSSRQKKSYRRDRTFRVRAKDGKRFRLSHGRSGNVVELNHEGKPMARFCIHPQEHVPDADTLLAQKFLLETDPDAFRRIANRTALPVG